MVLAVHVSEHDDVAATVTEPDLVHVWPSAVTVSVQGNVPAWAYVCDGFCAVAWGDPSPKLQS